LSQYFNALLFKIFGVSFRTLIFANLTITAGLLVLVYRCFLAAADRLTATMICLAIVLVFAFQHSG
jgi:4-amino-4-deoxy-L-arabinose transferase-like glycosyltransferase